MSSLPAPDEKTSDLQELKRKSLAGVGTLFVRQILLKLISFTGNILLARLLVPQIFGIYAIVVFVVQFFSTFSDVGLGAALIQKKGELTKEELSTTFWLQQLLVWFVAIIIIIVAPLSLLVYPSLQASGIWLIRAMALSFILTSLKTIPAILMERRLDFKKIAWVDITEILAFQITAVLFALAGFEAWSFVIAAVTRGILGSLVVYYLSPWRPGLYLHLPAVRDLVRFGLPYQGNGILSFIKDAVTPLFVGAYAGAAAVGFVNWGRSFAFLPLIVSESFGRVAFPAYSRIQFDRELLVKAVERSMRMMTLILFPITIMMAALGPDIVHHVFTDKWMPGIWAFYFYCTSPMIIGVMLPMYSAILSLGQSHVILKMTVLLLILEWGLGVPFVLLFGFTGIAVNQPIIAILFFFLYKSVLKSAGIRLAIFKHIKYQLSAALVSGITIKFVAQNVRIGLIVLPLLYLLGCLLFIGLLFMIKRDLLREFIGYVADILRRDKDFNEKNTACQSA